MKRQVIWIDLFVIVLLMSTTTGILLQVMSGRIAELEKRVLTLEEAEDE